jgi:hypothetical protein
LDQMKQYEQWVSAVINNNYLLTLW